MKPIELYDHQWEALNQIKNGNIICGGTGSGKSRTALAYFYISNNGTLTPEKATKMKKPLDLFIITTAKKRDSLEWEDELQIFGMSTYPEESSYKHMVVVDSWNNIQKYRDVKGAFFIFDEQRVVGSGAWVKAFLKIAKANQWILLSATPGDTWSDYIPVFVANGFYRNRTEFVNRHVIFARFSKFPKIDRYIGELRLEQLRSQILVDMHFERSTVQNHTDIYAEHNQVLYKQVTKTRWNVYKEQPIMNAAELCYVWRKVVNSDPDRGEHVLNIVKACKKAIIFYNFDYELDILRDLDYPKGTTVAEWNGHKHDPIPTGSKWVYLVQYNAGAEGWNCITTDTMIFFSQTYSYKTLQQAVGRIDRLNTPYKNLYYYHIKSRSKIDMAISKALSQKKKFNEKSFVKW